MEEVTDDWWWRNEAAPYQPPRSIGTWRYHNEHDTPDPDCWRCKP